MSLSTVPSRVASATPAASSLSPTRKLIWRPRSRNGVRGDESANDFRPSSLPRSGLQDKFSVKCPARRLFPTASCSTPFFARNDPADQIASNSHLENDPAHVG